MIIEFPHGHEYDFDLLLAGLKVLLNAEPHEFEAQHFATWPSDESPVKISAAPHASMMRRASGQPMSVYATAYGSVRSNNYRVRLREEPYENVITVDIPWGHLDDISETVGFWRFGNPKPILDKFEFK